MVVLKGWDAQNCSAVLAELDGCLSVECFSDPSVRSAGMELLVLFSTFPLPFMSSSCFVPLLLKR